MNSNLKKLVKELGQKGNLIVASHNEETNYEISKLVTCD